MCWQSGHCEIHIADTDIICYKATTYSVKTERKYFNLFGPKVQIFKSNFWNYPYIIGKQTPRINIIPSLDIVNCTYRIKRGYHSWKNPYVYGSTVVMAKCIIPKGTKYCISDNGMDLVSERLIVREIIN